MSSSQYFRRNQQHPRRVDPFVHYIPHDQKQQRQQRQQPEQQVEQIQASPASTFKTKMEDSNIVAIPHHPPLPRNVSGIFQGPEAPYVSAQASKSSTVSRDSTSSATYGSDQPLRLQQQQQQQQPQQRQQQQSSPLSFPQRSSLSSPQQSLVPLSSATESHSRSTYRPRANTGSFLHSASNGFSREGVMPQSDTSGINASDFATRPPHMSRRESAIGFAPPVAGANFDSSMAAAHHARTSDAGNMFNSSVANAISQRRSRRESVGSNISETASVEKGGSNSDRKYVCDWADCGQAFDRVEHLNRHKRRHTGEKPYRCLISKCTKLFSRFDNMMQHVGIHCIDGVKTEIPNIKNLNSRCNGRGRVRRTSYRGTQDSYEKFRRHVESSLGPILAECCILPTKNPDFSNLTLRPLLNDHVPATISEDTPLCESVATPGVVSQNASYKRPRCDSVVDGMDKHFPGGSASSSRSLTSPSSDIFRTMSPPTKKHARLDMINYVNQHQHSGKHLQAHRGSSSSSSFIVAEHDANAERARNGIYSDSYIFPRQIQEHRLSYPVYPALIQPPAHMAEFSHRMHSGSLGGITSSAMPTSNVRSQSGGYKQR